MIQVLQGLFGYPLIHNTRVFQKSKLVKANLIAWILILSASSITGHTTINLKECKVAGISPYARMKKARNHSTCSTGEKSNGSVIKLPMTRSVVTLVNSSIQFSQLLLIGGQSIKTHARLMLIAIKDLVINFNNV